MKLRVTAPSAISWLTGAEVPTDWQTSRIRYLAPEMRAGEAITADSIETTGTYPVYGGNGLRGYTNEKTHAGIRILIGRQGALCGNVHLVDGEFWASEHAIVVQPGSGVDPRWLAHLLRVMDLGQYSQTAAQPGIGTAQISALEAPVPSLAEQRTIADFLDDETARIDTLIEEQERLIELLRERRDTVWADGLARAAGAGRTVQLRHVISSIVDGPFGSALTSTHYSDAGARVIRLGNIGVNEFRGGDAAYIPLAYADELSAHAVQQGDVVIAGLGDEKMPLGRAAVVPDLGPAIVKADCYRARPNAQVTAPFLAWALSAPQTRGQIQLLARGATRARLNTSVVLQVQIPLPDINVQTDLVSSWAGRAAKIDALVLEAERFMTLARERRAALIIAAITGQIDVRDREPVEVG